MNPFQRELSCITLAKLCWCYQWLLLCWSHWMLCRPLLHWYFSSFDTKLCPFLNHCLLRHGWCHNLPISLPVLKMIPHSIICRFSPLYPNPHAGVLWSPALTLLLFLFIHFLNFIVVRILNLGSAFLTEVLFSHYLLSLNKPINSMFAISSIPDPQLSALCWYLLISFSCLQLHTKLRQYLLSQLHPRPVFPGHCHPSRCSCQKSMRHPQPIFLGHFTDSLSPIAGFYTSKVLEESLPFAPSPLPTPCPSFCYPSPEPHTELPFPPPNHPCLSAGSLGDPLKAHWPCHSLAQRVCMTSHCF